MLMLISANDFIALYLGFELMSLALYVIAAYRRHDVRATEAGLKYFVLGALSSGMMLYGMSLIYGYSGSVSFSAVAEAVHDHASIGVLFGLVFILAGLAFKISAVPFHMWTPDVYEGAPTPVTTFFATGAQGRGDGGPGSGDDHRLSGHRKRLAPDHHLRLDRLDGARRLRRHRPAQLQAPDGLFVDRPYGLRAGWPRGGHRRGRAKRRHLYGDLRRDDAWNLRRHSVDAASAAARSRRWPTSPAWRGPIRPWPSFWRR